MGVSPFALFLKSTRGHPALAVDPKKRGKLAWQMFQALNTADRKALCDAAAQITFRRRPKQTVAKVKSEPWGYSCFVKDNWAKFSGPAPKRMKQIAQLYRQLSKTRKGQRLLLPRKPTRKLSVPKRPREPIVYSAFLTRFDPTA